MATVSSWYFHIIIYTGRQSVDSVRYVELLPACSQVGYGLTLLWLSHCRSL